MPKSKKLSYRALQSQCSTLLTRESNSRKTAMEALEEVEKVKSFYSNLFEKIANEAGISRDFYRTANADMITGIVIGEIKKLFALANREAKDLSGAASRMCDETAWLRSVVEGVVGIESVEITGKINDDGSKCNCRSCSRLKDGLGL